MYLWRCTLVISVGDGAPLPRNADAVCHSEQGRLCVTPTPLGAGIVVRNRLESAVAAVLTRIRTAVLTPS